MEELRNCSRNDMTVRLSSPGCQPIAGQHPLQAAGRPGRPKTVALLNNDGIQVGSGTAREILGASRDTALQQRPIADVFGWRVEPCSLSGKGPKSERVYVSHGLENLPAVGAGCPGGSMMLHTSTAATANGSRSACEPRERKVDTGSKVGSTASPESRWTAQQPVPQHPAGSSV